MQRVRSVKSIVQNERSVAAGQLIQDLSLVAGPKPTKPFSTAHHKDTIREFLLPLPFDFQLERTVVIKLIVQVVVLLLRGSVTRRDTSHLHVMPESHLATELIEGRSPGLSRQLKEPWNELLLTIGPNGTCETKFEYP